jgi:hypothetical protein
VKPFLVTEDLLGAGSINIAESNQDISKLDGWFKFPALPDQVASERSRPLLVLCREYEAADLGLMRSRAALLSRRVQDVCEVSRDRLGPDPMGIMCSTAIADSSKMLSSQD